LCLWDLQGCYDFTIFIMQLLSANFEETTFSILKNVYVVFFCKYGRCYSEERDSTMLFEEVTIITFVHCIEDCNWFFRPTS
jgi:hypothetical protein